MTYMIHEFLNYMVMKWNMISQFFVLFLWFFMQITHFFFSILLLLLVSQVRSAIFSPKILIWLCYLWLICVVICRQICLFIYSLNEQSKSDAMRTVSPLKNQWPCLRSNNRVQKLIIICQFMCGVPCYFSKINNDFNSQSSTAKISNPSSLQANKETFLFFLSFHYTHFYSTLMNESSNLWFCLINSLWYYTWTHL